jgi:very-short-patch-repair endonuclease
MPFPSQQSLCLDFSQAVTQRADERKIPLSIGLMAQAARQSLSALETRFITEARRRWPAVTWRRYHPIGIRVHREWPPSIWYAPFYAHAAKLIVSVDSQPDFPYTIAGKNGPLYADYGYRVLDFTEDFLGSPEESVWQEAMGMVGARLKDARG